jgi:2-polyprenyl-3-methyl-5-hydroxy-6-metoxy-1,4-benzoquinol methylase
MVIENEGISCRQIETCELCAEQGKVLYSNLRDQLFSAPGTWAIRACPKCALLWSDPQPFPDQIHKLYRTYYTHSGNPQFSSFRSQGKAKLAKDALAKILFWKPYIFQSDNLHLQGLPPGDLIEVGCGSGGFLAALAREGWKCHGIDFDESAIAEARKIPGVRAEVAELTQRAFPANSFDAVVMNNVIEHIWNPIATVTECYRILRPRGRLVMITPNSRALGHVLYRQDWRGLEVPRHLFIYNYGTIRALAKKTGFLNAVAFSSSGGASGREILKASAEIAARAKRPTKATPRLTIIETALGIAGIPVGEWIVLIATKQA